MRKAVDTPWTDDQLAWLGVIPDHKATDVMGRTIHYIRAKRIELGIIGAKGLGRVVDVNMALGLSPKILLKAMRAYYYRKTKEFMTLERLSELTALPLDTLYDWFEAEASDMPIYAKHHIATVIALFMRSN